MLQRLNASWISARRARRALLLFAYLFLTMASSWPAKPPATRCSSTLRRVCSCRTSTSRSPPWSASGCRSTSGSATGPPCATSRSAACCFSPLDCLIFWVIAHDLRPGLADPRHLHLGRRVRRPGAGAGVDAGQLRADDARGQADVRLHRQRRDLGLDRRRLPDAGDRQPASAPSASLLGVASPCWSRAGIVGRLWRRRPVPDAESRPRGHAGRLRCGIRASLRLIRRSPYLRAIAAVILLSALATTIAGWQFKAIAGSAIPGTDELAMFFGTFNIFAGLMSLALQWLLTGRLLRRPASASRSSSCRSALLFGSIGLLCRLAGRRRRPARAAIRCCAIRSTSRRSSCCICRCPADRDVRRQVVHRHGRLPAGRRARRRRRSSSPPDSARWRSCR